MIKREWRAIVGYEGVYEVADDGRIRRIDRHPQSMHFRKSRKKFLSEGRNKAGYRHVTLCRNGKTQTIAVHRVVALAFHGQPPPRHECAHIDGRPPNCKKENLEWVTRRRNHFHKRAHGTHRCGEKAYFAKLTAPEVIQILALKDVESQAVIGARFRVSQTAVNHIHNGRSWMHITGLSGPAKDQ